MKLVSLNVGLPREVPWHGRMVTTSIFKEPVAGRIALRKLNFDGDRQADLTVHGGEFKAVYAYPIEHYAYWKKELPGRELPFGSFGENLTTEGLLETSLHLGDRVTLGSAELIVTQPRLPCYKLGLRFNSDEMVKRFLASARTGSYFAVVREGQVAAGDEIALAYTDPRAVPVSEITRLYVEKNYTDADAACIQRALQVPSFPDSWKQYLEERLARVGT
jgi:MOSC domain-containing protein YiiM